MDVRLKRAYEPPGSGDRARQAPHLDAGAQMIMIESDGITEQVREWRTDVVARIGSELAAAVGELELG